MEKLFLVYQNKKYTYNQLLTDLNNRTYYSCYLYNKENDPYGIFVAIIHSLIYDYPLHVLDGTFSNEELNKLGIDYNTVHKVASLENRININSEDELLKKIQSVKQWHLILYTSGTTGRPKKVSQSFASLTKNVKTTEKFYDDIWAFAYNPTHIAGLQVFFQALLNLNPIIYVFDLPFNDVPQILTNYKVTSISATPTFYRNVLPFLIDCEFQYVKNVTQGGEKYDPLVAKQLKEFFPNAKFRNIYATTETGTLFTSDGEIFSIPETILNYVKISEQNELLIHEKLLGKSETYILKDGWYETGDFIEKIDDRHFKFKTRKSEMINVGGYKVSPTEVEAVLLKVSGVKDVVVKGRKSSVTGEIVVAEVVKDPVVDVDEKELKKSLKNYASQHLSDWKVPRIIKVIDEIQITRSGKKVRK